MLADTIRHDPQACPYCGAEHGAAGSPDGRPTTAPVSGDFLICFDCTQPAVAVVSPLGLLTFRKPTEEEMARFAVDHGHIAVQMSVFHANRRGH